METGASETEWLIIYTALLQFPIQLCFANGLDLSVVRDRANKTGTTFAQLRPDIMLHYKGLVLFRGEEKSASTPICVPEEELTSKMRRWNPMFYGDLSYILGYATSGQTLKIVAIDNYVTVHEIAKFRSITTQKADVIKAFYNLAFILDKMSTFSYRMQPTRLLPFTPDKNEKRTLMLLDDRIRRTIKLEGCQDKADFDRLAGIYEALRELYFREAARTHLQTVLNLEVMEDPAEITVELNPLGYERRPTDDREVYGWLQDTLTALSYWHGCGYCHGDIRWRNIVCVPSDPAYWVLIDMDESRRPDTTIIRWRHPFQSHKLCFQHDLYQVGKLMQRMKFSLCQQLVGVQNSLLSAVQTHEVTAENVLATLELINLGDN